MAPVEPAGHRAIELEAEVAKLRDENVALRQSTSEKKPSPEKQKPSEPPSPVKTEKQKKAETQAEQAAVASPKKEAPRQRHRPPRYHRNGVMWSEMDLPARRDCMSQPQIRLDVRHLPRSHG